MKRLILYLLVIILPCRAVDSMAQISGKDNNASGTALNPDKEPYIDEDGNKIPWYKPMPDDGQTRTTVDMRFAPASMKMVEPSPEAARATKYADFPVSYGLGLVDVNIPLYVVKSHSLTLPISLSYDSGGIRVDDVSGPAGLGWTLEAGGVITRSVMGINDDSAVGWPHRPDPDPTVPNYWNSAYLEDVAKGDKDSEADLYSFNFCGHRGSFFVDWDTYPWTVTPTSATDLLIEVTAGGFKITDTDGTTYLFTQQETSARSTSITQPFYGAGSSPQNYPGSMTPITAWYLTEIDSMDRTDVIKLHYRTYGDLYISRHANTRTYQFTYKYNSPDYLWLGSDGLWNSFPAVSSLTGAYVSMTSWQPHHLDYITFAGGRVDFKYSQNVSVGSNLRRSYPWVLDYISVKSLPPASASETEVFRATFTLPFKLPDRRNLLSGVSLTGRGGTPIETYSFTYINEGTAMDTNSKDLFGYYNGADNSAGTAFLRLCNTDPFNETVANRNYNSSVVSNLSLETITTASGAKTRFQYEGNAIQTVGTGLLFSYLGVGHRIRRISTYDLSGGGETLVRQRDFTYSSPGITIPFSAFKHTSFLTVTEVFREDLAQGHPWWCGPFEPIPRTATVAFSDQSVLPGASLENARIFYGSVTERVSDPAGNASVRTDYEFDTSGAAHTQTGVNWILGAEQDAHDDSYNTQGLHSYHFYQRPPQYVYINNYETSVNLSQPWYHFIPEDFPQLTSPTVIRKYKREAGMDKLISQTVNEYDENKATILTGLRVRNMIAGGDENNMQQFVYHVGDYYRAGIYQKRKWHRLRRSTEMEYLDDDSTQTAVTTYSYIPASTPSTSIPAVGAVLSPKSRSTVYSGGGVNRTYTWWYLYPSEVSGGLPWLDWLTSMGYRKPFIERVTAGTGSNSATSSRTVTWAAFSPPDTSGVTIYRPSAVTLSRKEPGSTTTENVGPTVHYEAYDRHGNILQVRQDNEKPVTYVWGYGGLRPVLEITGGTYSLLDSTVGHDDLKAISDSLTKKDWLTAARASLEAASDSLLVSWYLYDLPFGMSQASDVSRILTQYEYDGAGRLTTVKDADGNRVNTYSYALNNGGNGSPNRISSVTHTAEGASATDGVLDVVYFDGLGRTVQTVAAKASTVEEGVGIHRDLVTPFSPDFLDREDARVYLPYPAQTNSANIGSFRTGAIGAQQSYHGFGVKAYSENTYESSDRDRVIASSLPGFTETTETRTEGSPANTVLNLSFDASTHSVSADGYHSPNRFIVTVTEGPDGSHTEVFTDELGTPVLERVKLDAAGDTADTYYIRDILGRTLCVVPPDQSALLSSSTSNFSTSNCYTYRYDGRDRVVRRQLPGNVEEVIEYNDLDLPVKRTRKAADGSSNDEIFTTYYDGIKRPIREAYKYGTNAEVTLAEYSYDSYPSGTPAFADEASIVTSADKYSYTRGLKTAERITLLPAGVAPSELTPSNTSTRETRSFFYDAKGRVRQIARINTQGDSLHCSFRYTFPGDPLVERQRARPASANAAHTLERAHVRDMRYRPFLNAAYIDQGPMAWEGYSYDEMQRIGSVSRNGGVEATNYYYTLQGWLQSMSSTSWEETLRYASPSKSGTDPLPGKVGLITEWTHQQKGTSSDGSTTAETFSYFYDKAGRLTGSLRHVGDSNSGVNTLTERNITYDRSGNLLTLDRYGDSSGTTPTESLSYTYTGPKRNTWTYDAHGNVTADPQAGLGIAWNVIGLPRAITASAGTGSATTQRSYLADGTLAQVSDGTTTRLYLGDMVFEKAADGTVTLESAGWEGGRLLPGTGADKVLYVVKDHLGSVRVVKDGTGTIRQRFDYYPYGTVSRSWTSSATTDDSEKRYRFGGKEIAGSALTDMAGKGVAPAAPYLDFGARLYSPRTAMWLSADPLAEKYYGISPYDYCTSNPANRIDPTGKHDYYLNKNGTWTRVDTNDEFDVIFAPSGEQFVVLNRDIMGNMNQDTGKIENDKYFLYWESPDLKKPSKKPLHYSVFSGNDPEALSVFRFLSDNTTVEWLLYYGANSEALLGTNHMSGFVDEDWIKYWVVKDGKSEVMSKPPVWKIHNHPGDTPDEIDSMSVDRETAKRTPSVHSFVYITQSGNIYDIHNNITIKNITWPYLRKRFFQ